MTPKMIDQTSRGEPWATSIRLLKMRWPPPDVPGQVLFGRYELIERIGAGTTGVVWRVRRLDLECERALKLIRPEIAHNEKAWRRLERKARSIAQLRHPNIVDIYDVKRSDGIGYIEMELVPGRSLAEIIEERRGQPMPLGWTIEFCSQLCSALRRPATVTSMRKWQVKANHPLRSQALEPDARKARPHGDAFLSRGPRFRFCKNARERWESNVHFGWRTGHYAGLHESRADPAVAWRKKEHAQCSTGGATSIPRE